jgi:hypothetical protein
MRVSQGRIVADRRDIKQAVLLNQDTVARTHAVTPVVLKSSHRLPSSMTASHPLAPCCRRTSIASAPTPPAVPPPRPPPIRRPGAEARASSCDHVASDVSPARTYGGGGREGSMGCGCGSGSGDRHPGLGCGGAGGSAVAYHVLT